MDRVNKILHNEDYIRHINRIEELEVDRIYCRHDYVHFFDVARIATIINMEEKLAIDKSVIYAAALLHDVGRDEQYISGIAHEEASSKIAPQILKDSGYNDNEINIIVGAIREHGNEQIKMNSDLMGIIYRGDKLSRKCFACKASESCHKAVEKRNYYMNY